MSEDCPRTLRLADMATLTEPRRFGADTRTPDRGEPARAYGRCMARLPRYVFPDGIYHVVTRGVATTPVYRDDDDRRFFLGLLGAIASRNDWVVHAFCLMTTHYHLVVEALRDQLSNGMHRLNGAYAEQFNQRYNRRGHLWGDRFWSGLIESDEELEATWRYVLENPVRAGLCEDAAAWPWSGSRYGFDFS